MTTHKISAAFDQAAAEYDRDFSETELARTLRQSVWDRLAANFKTGDHILELNCGTGEDAIWLARHGMQVTATDVSLEMLNVARKKIVEAELNGRIDLQRLDLALPTGFENFSLDGVLSNFGGLNCVHNLHPIANFLGARIKPDGKLILVPMNRWCAWEIVWHVLHLQFRTAFRRLKSSGSEAVIGAEKIRVWYPSIRSLRKTFEPQFKLERIIGLGIFLPPSYLERSLAWHPKWFRWLNRLEQKFNRYFPLNRLGDHVILEFDRTEAL
jgi:ubiquinone/menaquinone biosynthesis C-methylase UbiE